MRALQPAPRDDDVRVALVIGAGPDLHHGEVRRSLAPGEPGIARGIGLEHAQAARGRVVQLDAVAEPALRVDDHGEQSAALLPAEVRHVAQAGVPAGRELAHDDVEALALAALRHVAAQGEVAAITAEREARDVVHRDRRAGPQIDEPELAAHRLARLFERFALLLRHADRVREPTAVRGELRVAAVLHRARGVGGKRATAKLLVAVDARDRVRQPVAVGRERRAARRFPPVVVGGHERGLLLAGRRRRAERQREEHESGPHRPPTGGPHSDASGERRDTVWTMGSAAAGVWVSAPRPRSVRRAGGAGSARRRRGVLRNRLPTDAEPRSSVRAPSSRPARRGLAAPRRCAPPSAAAEAVVSRACATPPCGRSHGRTSFPSTCACPHPDCASRSDRNCIDPTCRRCASR